MTVGWSLRTLRAALFAVVCVVPAAVGHVLMSDDSLPGWVLASALACAMALGWACSARERRQSAVVVLTTVTQAVLHTAFTLSQTSSGPAPRPPGETELARRWADYLVCGPGHDVNAVARAYDVAADAGLVDGAPLPRLDGGATAIAALQHAGHGAAGAHDMGAMTGTASWGMLSAHLVAALLCGLWLAQGERAAFRIVRAAAERMAIPFALLLACPSLARRVPARRASRFTCPRPRIRLLVHVLVTRGPPAEAAVL